MTDWDNIRKYKVSGDRHEDWPDDVYAISLEGLTLLGIHKNNNKLYWDGHEIVTKTVVRLRWLELWLVILAAFSTFGIFVLNLGSSFNWWN